MNKKLLVISALTIILVVVAIVFYFSAKHSRQNFLGSVGPGDECQENNQCPSGFTCGLKVDTLPGARGKCVKP